MNKSIFDNVQYFIAVVMAIFFAFSLFNFSMLFVVSIAILIQLIISILRFRVFGIFLEIFILILVGLSFIPFLGILFKILGLFAAIFEMAIFKNSTIYKQVEIRTFNSKQKKSKNKKVTKPKVEFEDADFKEK